MRAACIAVVRAEQKYEGSDFPVCNAIVHAIEQIPALTPTPQAGGDTDYRNKLRMVISHASGGHLSDEADVERSINDICVQISQHYNRVWEVALEKGRKQAGGPGDEAGLRKLAKAINLARDTDEAAHWIAVTKLTDAALSSDNVDAARGEGEG